MSHIQPCCCLHLLTITLAQRVMALERFKALEHELLPARLPVWQEALDALDLKQPCEALVGTWFPEPELLVSPSSKIRLLTYISNWMSLRVPLLARLGRQTIYAPVTQNSWRTLLSRFPEQSDEEKRASEQLKTLAGSSKNTSSRASGEQSSSSYAQTSAQGAKREAAAQRRHQQKEAVCRYFTAFLGFQSPLLLRIELIQSFVWRDVVVTLDKAAAQAGEMSVPADIIREIAWELGEVAFRVEVCELDMRMSVQQGARALRIRHELLEYAFPGAHWSRPDYPRPLQGLPAEASNDRVDTLESLRILVSRWPGCPPVLQTKSFRYGVDTTELERVLAKFYCQCAFLKFGRAAAVPRQLPDTLRAPLPQAQQVPAGDAL